MRLPLRRFGNDIETSTAAITPVMAATLPFWKLVAVGVTSGLIVWFVTRSMARRT